MKTLIASVKFLTMGLVVAIVVGFLIMDQINIRNTWLHVKPVSNAANIVNLIEREKNLNPELVLTGEVNIGVVQTFMVDVTEEEKLYDETFFYVEGTFEEYCVVTFNATDNLEEENMIIKSSESFSTTLTGPGGHCSEGIVERAYNNSWYVGPEGGVPIM